MTRWRAPVSRTAWAMAATVSRPSRAMTAAPASCAGSGPRRSSLPASRPGGLSASTVHLALPRRASRAPRRMSASAWAGSAHRHQHVQRLPLACASGCGERLRDDPQPDLAQRGQGRGPEQAVERLAADLPGRVDVAVSQPFAQRLGGVVEEPDFVGLREGRVGHRGCRGLSRDLAYLVGGALQVAHVDGADDVDPRVPQRPDGGSVPAEVIDEDHGGLAGQHGVEVHLLAGRRAAGLAAGGPGGRGRSPGRAWPRRSGAGRGLAANPTTTSSPRSRSARPSRSMVKVFPDPGAAPRYRCSVPRRAGSGRSARVAPMP